MPSAPRGSGISASTVTGGSRGSRASTQFQKRGIRTIGTIPSPRNIGVQAKSFEGHRPRGNALYVGKLRAGATVRAF